MGYKKIKSKTQLSGFYVSYFGSVMNEHKGIYGISHLMEHLVCKGIDDLMNTFEEEGISWNAWTSDREICFYMTGLDNNIKKWKKTFYERITNFNITEEKFLNEKKIVIEEYKDSFNTQSEGHRKNLFRKIYGHYGAIGLLEDLETLTLKDCYDFFEKQYKKPNYIIDISRSSNSEKMNEFFNNVEYNDNMYDNDVIEFKIGDFPLEKGNDYKDKTSIIYVSPVIEEDNAYVDFIAKMLGGGLKSPLYQEIREKRGLVYYVHCYQRDVTNKSGVILIETETSKDNADKVLAVIDEVIGNPSKYLTKKRFNIVKNNYKIKLKKENILLHSNGYKFIEPDNYLVEKIIDVVTYDKIKDVYEKYFNIKNFYKSIDSEEFKK